MRPGQSRAKLLDCTVHGAGSGAELFLVEGESAASSVAGVCQAHFQAVLPLQGKPMNAWRAPAEKVRGHALYAQWAQALGIKDATALEHALDDQLADLRFERIVLLLDPDADGIHIGALMLLFLQRWAPVLLRSGRVEMARAPMFVLQPQGLDDAALSRWAYTPAQCETLRAAWVAEHGDAPRVQAVRGLGSFAPALLAKLCVDPTTRNTQKVSAADVQAVIDVFGGAPA